MPLLEGLTEDIAGQLAELLENAGPGHCLRVEGLDAEDCEAMCSELRRRTSDDTRVFVLSTVRDEDPWILPEKAIELRNEVRSKFCLFIPVGTVHATLGSLMNAFATVDLQELIGKACDRLLGRLRTRPIGQLVREVERATRNHALRTSDRFASFLAVVERDPTELTVGRELWRIGLLPDLDPDGLQGRLQQNVEVTRRLTASGQARKTLRERLAECGLHKGEFADRFQTFLREHPDVDPRRWMSKIAYERQEFSFDKWPLEATAIESVEIAPFILDDGRVDPKCGLRQPDGPGGAIIGDLGRGSVRVRWRAVPDRPQDVGRWLVELELLDEGEGEGPEEEEEFELPRATTKARSRSKKISLRDLPDFLAGRRARVVVTAQSRDGIPLTGKEGKIVQAASEEFWLEKVNTVIHPSRTSSERNVALARLRALIGSDATELRVVRSHCDPAAGKVRWEYEGIKKVEITFSPLLAQLERESLQRPDELLAFWWEGGPTTVSPTVESFESMSAENVAADEVSSRFLDARRRVFQLIAQEPSHPIVAAHHVVGDLATAVREYAAAYRELLAAPIEEQARWELLRLDTVELRFTHLDEVRRVVVVLPIHPVRLLWLTAYHELLASWEKQLVRMDPRQRRKAIDMGFLEGIEGAGFPFLVQGASGQVYWYAQPLDFCWAIGVPPDDPDADKSIELAGQLLGRAPDSNSNARSLPDVLSEHLKRYVQTRRGCHAVRIKVVNPGTGDTIARTLDRFIEGFRDSQAIEGNVPRIDLTLHATGRDPQLVGNLRSLQEKLYRETDLPPGRSHVTPFFAFAFCDDGRRANAPGGASHVAFLFDRYQSKLTHGDAGQGEDSILFHGLALNLFTELKTGEQGVEYLQKVVLPEQTDVAPHPGSPEYTTELIELQRAHLGAFLGDDSVRDGPLAVAFVTRLSPGDIGELERVHADADWVITVDRCIGPELFDNPDVHTDHLFQRYLLDYDPEFQSGVGRRIMLTTGHRQEVLRMFGWAAEELGFTGIDTAEEFLRAIKLLSARLGLRSLVNELLAREVVSLAAVLVYLKQHGQLHDCMLIPVEFHEAIFGLRSELRRELGEQRRCDFLKVALDDGRILLTLVEVKSSYAAGSTDSLQRIRDQLNQTERLIRRLFFSSAGDQDGDSGEPVDAALQRSRLVAMLRHYASRSLRHGLFREEEAYRRALRRIAQLQGQPYTPVIEKIGYVVDPQGRQRAPVQFDDVRIEFLTAAEFADVGLTTALEDAAKTVPIGTRPDGGSAPGSPTAPTGEHRDLLTVAEEGEGDGSEDEDAEPAGAEMEQKADRAKSEQADRKTAADEAEAGEEPSREEDRPPVSHSGGIVLGTDTAGQEVIWRPSVQGSPHVLILGIPGQGKSVTTTRIILEAARSGLSCFVFDYHGEFSRPESPLQRLHRVNVVRPTPLPFSPLEPVGDWSRDSWKAECVAVREIVAYVCGLGEIQAYVFEDALEAAYEEQVSDGQLQALPTMGRVWELLQKSASQQRDKRVVFRTKQLFDYGLFADVTRPEQDAFRRLLKGITVLDLSGLKQDTLQHAAAAFTLRRIYCETRLWRMADRVKLLVVLDEAHRLARDRTLPKIMKEHRKFGVAAIVASQNLRDFHEAVIDNAGTRIVFRVNHPDSAKIARFLVVPKVRDVARLIQQLSVGQAIVQLAGERTARVVQMKPPDGMS